MIEKVKESETFGLIVGSLSLEHLNEIINSVKTTLKQNKKKFYTFLLGKITLEKLSNFVDYIDCFIFIGCPFNNFYNFKTLNKPLVNSLDVKIAFNDYFKWDMKYSFDPSYILHNISNEESNQSSNISDTNQTISQFFCLDIKEYY